MYVMVLRDKCFFASVKKSVCRQLSDSKTHYLYLGHEPHQLQTARIQDSQQVVWLTVIRYKLRLPTLMEMVQLSC